MKKERGMRTGNGVIGDNEREREREKQRRESVGRVK